MSGVKQSLDKIQNNSNNVKVLIPGPVTRDRSEIGPRENVEIEQNTQNKVYTEYPHYHFPSSDAILVLK